MSPNLLPPLTSFIVCMLAASAVAADPALDHFERKIRPILVEQCYECHSAAAAKQDKLKGSLQLDTREGIRRGGDSGPSVVPGKPKQSPLLSALRFEDVEMPPKGQLSEETIRDFEIWIASGAIDPREGPPIKVKKAIDFALARQFWSLRPIASPAAPVVKDAAWTRGDVDRFVLARLEHEGLVPVGDAEDHVLVRRLYFDLHGLPPLPEAVEAFRKKASRDRDSAIAALVDDLLASPRFGERWGRHWLDVIRYAETNGRDINVVWYHAWRYRDWVIDAFNRDLPFDRFISHQIAGDLLSAGTPEERDQQIVATGMLAMTPKMISETNKIVFRMDLIDEQIDVISRAFLGLSISCARCHDHKFDPIPTRDYYALAGILGSTQPLYGPARFGAKNSPHSEYTPIGPHADRAPAAFAHLHQLEEHHVKFQNARGDRYRVVRRVADAKNQLAQPGSSKAELQTKLAELEGEVKVWDKRLGEMENELERLIAEPPPQPDWAQSVRDAKPADCHIHVRGEPTNLGDLVPRDVPQMIDIPGLPAVAPHESGRRRLSEWLASPDNPLTPRVAANRVWQHLFGRGLVATPDDFGVSGGAPSHPELLDHLSRKFVDGGWSVKKLIRDLTTSRAYRLASTGTANARQARSREHDPDALLLWCRRPRPLEVEPLRDAILSLAGRLNVTPPAEHALTRWNPYQEDTLWSHKPFISGDRLDLAHRSVFIPVLRDSLPELYSLFDFADPGRVTGQRTESIVPAQSLYLMNSPWIQEHARMAAARFLAEETSDDRARIERLYRAAFTRQPTEAEVARALAFLADGTATDQTPRTATGAHTRLKRWTSLCQTILASAEFRYLR